MNAWFTEALESRVYGVYGDHSNHLVHVFWDKVDLKSTHPSFHFAINFFYFWLSAPKLTTT